MRRLRPVIRSKGTFLSAQYLQAQDRFTEDTLQFRVEAVSFRPRSFASLRISQEGLAARNLAAYVPADFPNPQLELIILLPQAA